MRNNDNRKRRVAARAKVAVSPQAMAKWTLLRIIDEGMKSTGYYPKRTCGTYRTAVRNFERYAGEGQTAAGVTEDALTAFGEWMKEESYVESMVSNNVDAVAAVVRFADDRLLPSRGRVGRKKPKRDIKPSDVTAARLKSRERMRAAAAASKLIEGSLSRFVRRYIAARDVSETYKINLCRRAAALERFAGETAIESLLTEDLLNQYLSSLDRSPFTIRSYRTDFLSLWNAAADEDLVPYPQPRRIRRPKCPELIIDCYSVDEAKALLQSARRLQGAYPSGVEHRDYWPAAILLAWDSGLRRGDIVAFKKSAVRPDGFGRVVQHKTRRAINFRLRASTIQALDRIPFDQPLRWEMDYSYFGRHFQRIVKASGVKRGTFKWLRRSSGSYVEMEMAGAGGKHLGHSDPRMFGRHYDARLGGHLAPQPPELD